MRVLNKIAALALLLAGVLVMFFSSLVGGGLSGIIGIPLFAVGLGWLLLPRILDNRHKAAAGGGKAA